MSEVGTKETKLVYVKRWRTLVELPAKYADEIVESLRSSAVSARPVAWFCFVDAPKDDPEPLRIRAWTTDAERAKSIGQVIGRELEPLYRALPQTAPIGYVSQATLRLLSERGQAGHICPVPAYDTLIPVYAGPVQRCQAVCVDTDLLEALRSVQKLISEAAMTGFNCHDGDWAERLFHSQQATSAAIKKAALTRPPHNRVEKTGDGQ